MEAEILSLREQLELSKQAAADALKEATRNQQVRPKSDFALNIAFKLFLFVIY